MEIFEIIIFMIVELPHLVTMGRYKETEEEREKYFGFGFLFYFFTFFIIGLCVVLSYVGL